MPSLFRVQWRHRASPLHSTTLRLSNPSTDHTGSFPPFSNLFLLQDFSWPLWNNSSVQLPTRAGGRARERASHCHVLSIPVLSIHKVKRLQSLPTGLPLSPARAGTQSAHSCARQTSSQGPAISTQAPFGSSANSLWKDGISINYIHFPKLQCFPSTSYLVGSPDKN